MKNLNLLLLILICAMTIGCNGKTKDAVAAGPQLPQVKVPEGPLAQRLYQNFHANPQTIDQIDENKLIDYAVTNNLDVTKSASGLYYLITNVSDGKFYTQDTMVTAHYRGTTLDGAEFDSSYARGEPMTFMPKQMIKAWQEALAMMNTGASATLLVPSSLAYGKRGFPGYIDPDTPLVFTFECIK